MIQMARALRTGFVLLGASGSAITVLLAFQQAYPRASPDGSVAIITLSVFVVITSAALVWQEYRYARKARYAEALSYLNQVFYDTSRFDPQRSNSMDQVADTCRLIVNRLASAFTLVTGTKCSVCIKVQLHSADTGHGPPRLKVATLCRDDTSLYRETGVPASEQFIQDLKADPSAVDHWVDENTDFWEIWKRRGTPERCYFSNYLPGDPYYKNTSFNVYGEPPKSRFAWVRSLRWTLPYKSTIVAPIFRQTPLTNKSSFAGYLCVDSRSRSAFSRSYDTEVMTGAANCLFDLVHRYNTLAADLLAEGEDDDER